MNCRPQASQSLLQLADGNDASKQKALPSEIASTWGLSPLPTSPGMGRSIIGGGRVERDAVELAFTDDDDSVDL